MSAAQAVSLLKQGCAYLVASAHRRYSVSLLKQGCEKPR